MADEHSTALIKMLAVRLVALAAEAGIDLAPILASTCGIAPTPGHAGIAADLLHQRTIRADHFPADLFHEPAWDMLLALYATGADDSAMNIKALAAHTPAPPTTAQRWIDHLHRLGMVHRSADRIDRRAVTISLTAKGRHLLDIYLSRIADR